MNKKSYTLVEIMIVMGVIVILAAILIPNVIRSRITSNEAVAQVTLKTISSAVEMYALANNGQYPDDEEKLRETVPPYQNQAFCDLTLRGYTYTCGFETSSYSIVASPSECGKTGSKDFTVTNGAVLSSAPCGG